MFKSLIKLVVLLVALAGVFIIGQFFTGTTYWNNASWNKLLKEKAQESRLEVGRVIKRKGVAKASFQDDDRSLNVEDAIREGDRLQTGLLSRLRIKFNDGATLTLGEETSFLVEKYPQVPDGKLFSRVSVGDLLIPPAHAENDLPQPVVTMKRGVFSYVSGLMAKWLQKNNSSMTVFTPVATMGIRGTTLWSQVKEIPKPGRDIPERKLDVICMVPTCSVNKGGQEQVMEVPNTTMLVKEVQAELPTPVLAPSDKVVQAQVSTVVPKDLPKAAVEKLQQDMLQSLLGSRTVQNREEALQIVQSTLDTMVARTELRMASKALQEIEKSKQPVSDGEIQQLLEREAQKVQSPESYFRNVEELMKLKGGKQRVDDGDRSTVEAMDFSPRQMEEASSAVVKSATEEVKKALDQGKSVQDILKDEDHLKESVARDEQLRIDETPPPPPPVKEKLEKKEELEKTSKVEEEVRRKIEEERKARQEMADQMSAYRKELEALNQQKKSLEDELAAQLAKRKELEDALKKPKDTSSTFSPTSDQTLQDLEESTDETTEIPFSRELEAGLTVLNRLFTEPELMARIEALQTDADFKKALESSELRLLLAQGRYARAVFHPDFAKLMKHPAILDMLALAKKTQEDTYPMGTLTGSTAYGGASTASNGIYDLTNDYDAMLSSTGQ